MTIKDVSLDSNTKLPIKEFKMENIADNSAIVMIARRGSGKSWVCRAILNHFHYIPVGIIIAPTDKMSTFYGNFFPDSFIYYKYKTEIMQKLFTRQSKIIDKNKEKNKKGKKIDTRAFLLMDDCLSDKKAWAKDDMIYRLLYDGRHYHLMYVLTMQYALGLTPDQRNQFDYIFLFFDSFISNQKKLYDHYAGMFPTFEAFRQVFAQLTLDFGCMVIETTFRKNKKREQEQKDKEKDGIINEQTNPVSKIFWYKAGDPKTENMGCRQFRDYHDDNYDKDWRKKEDEFNFNDYCADKKKNKSSIKIQKVVE